MRNPKVYRASLFQLFMRDFLLLNKYRLYSCCSIKSFICIVCERFLVKLTVVDVHDKEESKFCSKAFCTYELNLFHFKVRGVIS